jgi:peptidoglycan/xylan/chitin deacetylase (PgdA/CDA1 family)
MTHAPLIALSSLGTRLLLLGIASLTASGAETVPDKLVVLTFDDSVASHYTVARPLLKRYGFGASFFITEGFSFRTNKRDYMTWEQIAELHREGFQVIALRDLARYVDGLKVPANPMQIMQRRRREMARENADGTDP